MFALVQIKTQLKERCNKKQCLRSEGMDEKI